MTVQLRFCGAARTVTGSCFLLETPSGRILVDCGLFQGSKTLKSLNYEPFPFRPKDIDAVLLTHAHIDHAGLVPKLVKEGFHGRVWATQGTIDLCSWMLPDSGNIQEMEVATLNRRNAARGRDRVEPIYTQAQARAALEAFRAVRYDMTTPILKGVTARFTNAGHLLGSASIELEIVADDGAKLRVLFSGDLGPDAKLLQPDPEAGAGYDYVICESTYGDRERPALSADTRRALLERELIAAKQAGGALLIPAFAVERTQELIVDIVDLMERGRVPAAPVFLDSPLAIRVSEVFKQHAASLDNGEALTRALNSDHLRFTETVDESRAIANLKGFHVILAASGMCEAGRIRHHLKRWLWQTQATVLLAGYQAQGTLGRFLVDGVKAVRIQGEEIRVAARIRSLDAYSGHADANELCRWIAARLPVRRAAFLVHGEEGAIAAFRARLAGDFLPEQAIIQPLLDDVYRLDAKRPVLIDGRQGRRLAPEAVVNLDWHNDLSGLILDINDQMRAAPDDRARGVILRRLRRALND